MDGQTVFPRKTFFISKSKTGIYKIAETRSFPPQVRLRCGIKNFDQKMYFAC